MARLFLSYSREDRHLVEPLAHLLERAGHSVWWDRRIAGGSDFSAEIARELAAAAVVLVAWSNFSVVSHWVKDEAAEGRDRGRLVPLLLNGVTPPLGFRQIQAVDLAGWDGDGQPAAFGELLRAIDLIASSRDQPSPERPMPPPVPAQASRASRFGLIAGLFAIALAVAAATFLLLRSRPAEPPAIASAAPAPVAAVPAPPAAPAAAGSAGIDGRWRISWTLSGTLYEGLLVAEGANARLEVNVNTAVGRQSVRQDCSLAGGEAIEVTCHNAEVISGPEGYAPDRLTLRREGADRLGGMLTDPFSGRTAPITARRE